MLLAITKALDSGRLNGDVSWGCGWVGDNTSVLYLCLPISHFSLSLFRSLYVCMNECIIHFSLHVSLPHYLMYSVSRLKKCWQECFQQIWALGVKTTVGSVHVWYKRQTRMETHPESKSLWNGLVTSIVLGALHRSFYFISPRRCMAGLNPSVSQKWKYKPQRT